MNNRLEQDYRDTKFKLSFMNGENQLYGGEAK